MIIKCKNCRFFFSGEGSYFFSCCEHKKCFKIVNDPIFGNKKNRIKDYKELNKNNDCKDFEMRKWYHIITNLF